MRISRPTLGQTTQNVLVLFVALLFSFDSTLAQTSNKTQSEDELTISARYHVESGTDKGFLIVKIKVPKESYIYSLSQPSPLLPSRLKVVDHKQFIADKTFLSDKQPKIIEHDPLFETRVEKHFGTVQFYVPIKVDKNVNLKTFQPEVQYSGQVCSDRGFCKQINGKRVRAKFAGYYQRDGDRQAKLPLPTIKQK